MQQMEIQASDLVQLFAERCTGTVICKTRKQAFPCEVICQYPASGMFASSSYKVPASKKPGAAGAVLTVRADLRMPLYTVDRQSLVLYRFDLAIVRPRDHLQALSQLVNALMM